MFQKQIFIGKEMVNQIF